MQRESFLYFHAKKRSANSSFLCCAFCVIYSIDIHIYILSLAILEAFVICSKCNRRLKKLSAQARRSINIYLSLTFARCWMLLCIYVCAAAIVHFSASRLVISRQPQTCNVPRLPLEYSLIRPMCDCIIIIIIGESMLEGELCVESIRSELMYWLFPCIFFYRRDVELYRILFFPIRKS